MKDIEKLRMIYKLSGELLQGDDTEPSAYDAGVLPPPSDPPWLDWAHNEIGTKEIKGSEHNERILFYLEHTTLGKYGKSRDETPWCSAFACTAMEENGIESTQSAMARSWLGWGVECEPKKGAVVILRRGNPPSGHVGFVWDIPRPGAITVLGGNQSDQVCIKDYPRSQVLGFRWPADPAE